MVTISIKKFFNLRWTLFLTYIIIGFCPLMFFSNTVFSTIDKYFVEERKKELLSQANVVSGHITLSDYLFDENKQLLFDYDIIQTSRQGGYRILVLDSEAMVVQDSNKTDEGKTFLVPEVIEAMDNKDVARLQSNGTIYAAVSIVDENSNKVGTVLISALATDISLTVNAIKNKVYIMLGAIMCIIGVVVVMLSRIFTDPLNSVLSVIVKMSDGHLDQRVPISDWAHNEIADLAVACNSMADKLEEVESTRQQFVSNVSHELKTPLSSIKVLSESILLQEDVPREMYIEFLQDINSEVDRMTAIINDLLTLVRLNRKEVPIGWEPTNLNNLAADIVKRLSPIASQKNISLTCENIKEDVLADIDAMKTTLAISNLIENGIKYTPIDGNVNVKVDADHQNAFFTVEDTGIGIPDDELGKIFERFYRVDKTRDRETGGTGLGLSITHSTILLHNGSIKVSSKENEGTTFVVRIPLHQNS